MSDTKDSGSEQFGYVVLCKNSDGEVVRVRGGFDTRDDAHKWRNGHWRNRASVRKVVSV